MIFSLSSLTSSEADECSSVAQWKNYFVDVLINSIPDIDVCNPGVKPPYNTLLSLVVYLTNYYNNGCRGISSCYDADDT